MVAGGVVIGTEQGGLRHFAMELGDFKLVGLLVAAEFAGGIDGLLPVPVLLVDVQQVFARAFGHVAVFEGEENLFGAVDQSGALVGLPQLEKGALFFVADGVGRFGQALQQADGFVVFAARAVEFAEGKAQLVRLRLHIGHFGQLARSLAAVSVH